jgi:transcription elongation GreA/GreB family factor
LRLKDEYRFLLPRDRPAVAGVVARLAATAISENADYQYGKRQLSQIDERSESCQICIQTVPTKTL